MQQLPAIITATHTRVHTQVTNRMFLALWFIAIPTAMGVVAVYALNQEFLSVKQEVKNGLYAPVSYLLSNAIIQVSSLLISTLSPIPVSRSRIDYEVSHQ